MRLGRKLAVFPVAWLALVAAAPAGDDAASGAKRPDEVQMRKQLCGTWKGFAVEGKGETPDRGPVKLELTFTEQTIHGIEIKGEQNMDHGEGQYSLDLVVAPFRLDAAKVLERGRKDAWVGIYSLEGDTLKWCVSKKQRPTTFETVKGQFLLILKRAQPAK